MRQNASTLTSALASSCFASRWENLTWLSVYGRREWAPVAILKRFTFWLNTSTPSTAKSGISQQISGVQSPARTVIHTFRRSQRLHGYAASASVCWLNNAARCTWLRQLRSPVCAEVVLRQATHTHTTKTASGHTFKINHCKSFQPNLNNFNQQVECD